MKEEIRLNEKGYWFQLNLKDSSKFWNRICKRRGLEEVPAKGVKGFIMVGNED